MMARPRKGEGVDPDAVLETAAEVFANRGYAGTTLDEVGRRLGVTRQAILHHFPGKQQLFQSVLERERRWADRATVAIVNAEDPAQQFAPLRHFLGLTPESRQRIRLQHVLQGEAIAGDPVAHDFITTRTQVIQSQVEARVQWVADLGRLAAGWSVAGAATALVALMNGLQAIVLIDQSIDIQPAFDGFVASIVSKEEGR